MYKMDNGHANAAGELTVVAVVLLICSTTNSSLIGKQQSNLMHSIALTASSVY